VPLSPDLAAVVRIKNMAQAAASDLEGAPSEPIPNYSAAYEGAQPTFVCGKKPGV
jgi:hypothetical protein